MWSLLWDYVQVSFETKTVFSSMDGPEPTSFNLYWETYFGGVLCHSGCAVLVVVGGIHRQECSGFWGSKFWSLRP